jgi:hypothetical protein
MANKNHGMKNMKIIYLLAITGVFIFSNTFSHDVELHFAGGYGFAKSTLPLSDYDKTYSNSSTSSVVTVSNVKDKYTSLGEGIRSKGIVIYYLEDHFLGGRSVAFI